MVSEKECEKELRFGSTRLESDRVEGITEAKAFSNSVFRWGGGSNIMWYHTLLDQLLIEK